MVNIMKYDSVEVLETFKYMQACCYTVHETVTSRVMYCTMEINATILPSSVMEVVDLTLVTVQHAYQCHWK